MRCNLIFSNIPESKDQHEDAEASIREFLVQRMKFAQDIIENIKFDRVHRMGPTGEGIDRNIVAKFAFFKERELVRRNSRVLNIAGLFVYEQFPKEVNDKRRKLIPRMKEEQKMANTAWLVYDTLYINGRPFREDSNK